MYVFTSFTEIWLEFGIKALQASQGFLFYPLPVVRKEWLHQSSPFCCKSLPGAHGNVHLPPEKTIH